MWSRCVDSRRCSNVFDHDDAHTFSLYLSDVCRSRRHSPTSAHSLSPKELGVFPFDRRRWKRAFWRFRTKGEKEKVSQSIQNSHGVAQKAMAEEKECEKHHRAFASGFLLYTSFFSILASGRPTGGGLKRAGIVEQKRFLFSFTSTGLARRCFHPCAFRPGRYRHRRNRSCSRSRIHRRCRTRNRIRNRKKVSTGSRAGRPGMAGTTPSVMVSSPTESRAPSGTSAKIRLPG